MNRQRTTLALTSLILLNLSTPALAKGSTKITADIGLEDRSFVFARDTHAINDQPAVDASFGFIYDNQKNFLINLRPRVHYDALDLSLLRYVPNEAYLKLYNEHWDFSVGMQTVSWGVARSYNPTDVMNRKDLAYNFYDPPKLGDPMVRLKFNAANVGAFSELSLEALAIPYLLETPLPSDDSRFAIAGSAGGISYTKADFQIVPSYARSVSAAIKAGASIKSTDVSVILYHGPERTPSYYLFLDNTLNLRAQPFYYNIDMVGLNVASVFGPVTLHGEASFKSTWFNDEQRHEIPLVDTSDAVPNSYAQFVTGVDYTFDGVFKKGTLILSAEYLGEDKHSSIFEEFRPLKNDVFVGLQFLLNDVRSTEVKAGVIKDLGNREMIVKLEGSTKIYKELKLTIGGMIINQDPNLNLPLSYFDNNTSVYTNLSYSFGKSL